MVKCNLHSTVVEDAARNKMIIMHPKPPRLSFIFWIIWMVNESDCKGRT